MGLKTPSSAVFFPAYNDGGTIGSLVVTTLKTLEELVDDYEVVVVENGSSDHTQAVLQELAPHHERFNFPRLWRACAERRKSQYVIPEP